MNQYNAAASAATVNLSTENFASDPNWTVLRTAPIGQSAPQGGGQYGIGISADVALNSTTDTTLAYIHDAVVGTNGGAGVDVHALNDTDITALSGGAAILTQSGVSFGLAGSYDQNSLGGLTSAFVATPTWLYPAISRLTRPPRRASCRSRRVVPSQRANQVSPWLGR